MNANATQRNAQYNYCMLNESKSLNVSIIIINIFFSSVFLVFAFASLLRVNHDWVTITNTQANKPERKRIQLCFCEMFSSIDGVLMLAGANF